MLLEIVETGPPRAFRLIGELDISNADTLGSLLDREIDERRDISLDLSELTFIDSSGVRVLIRAMDRLSGKGRLLLLSPSTSVQHVFSLMGLGRSGTMQVVTPDHQVWT
jgi:anti-anti-sigma factor